MISMEALTAFFGWCTVINFGVLLVTSILVMLLRKPVTKIHGKLSGLGEQDLLRAYFHYLGQYKISILIFNLTPYIALKLMA